MMRQNPTIWAFHSVYVVGPMSTYGHYLFSYGQWMLVRLDAEPMSLVLSFCGSHHYVLDKKKIFLIFAKNNFTI